METRSNHVLVGSVTLALLAGLLIFIVWLAGLSNKTTSCFDIYFGQGVGGLNKGSAVNSRGPVGQIEEISLLPNRPNSFGCGLRSMPNANPAGTTARSKASASRGQRDCARRRGQGARRCNRPDRRVPVIPASSGGLGALLNRRRS